MTGLCSLALPALLAACTPAGDAADAAATSVPATETSVPVAATDTPAPAPRPSATPAPVRASLPDLGPAPAWANEQWINSDALPLVDLRGKVVLLEFWTFG